MNSNDTFKFYYFKANGRGALIKKSYVMERSNGRTTMLTRTGRQSKRVVYVNLSKFRS